MAHEFAGTLVGWRYVTVFGVVLPGVRRRVHVGSVTAMHRYLRGLAVLLTVVHVGTLLADPYVPFGVLEVLLPLAARWRPGPVAWGVVAFYLLVLVEVTSLLRARLTAARWSRFHVLSYPLFAVATIHLLSAGTDVRRVVPQAVAVAVGILTVGLCLWGSERASRRRPLVGDEAV